MTNITGEKLSVNQIIDAIQNISQETGATPDHFKAEADTEKSRYIFRVEFTRAIEPDIQKKYFCQDLTAISNPLISNTRPSVILSV